MQVSQHLPFGNIVTPYVCQTLSVSKPRNITHLTHLHLVLLVEYIVNCPLMCVNVINMSVYALVSALEYLCCLYWYTFIAFDRLVIQIVHQPALLLHLSHRTLHWVLRHIALTFGKPPLWCGPHTVGECVQNLLAHFGIHQPIKRVECIDILMIVVCRCLLPQVQPKLFEGKCLDFYSLMNRHLHKQLLHVTRVVGFVTRPYKLYIPKRVSPTYHQILYIVQLFVITE